MLLCSALLCSALLCSALLCFYSAHALAFKDKHGREITLEWDIALSDQDRKVTHRGYFPQKQHYNERNIDFEKFFDDYNEEIAGELRTELKLDPDAQDRAYYLVRAKHEDQSIGFAYFKRKKVAGDAFFLEFITLEPEYQSCGIGKYLVFEIRKKFQKMRRLSLDTRDFNPTSHDFYKAIGFKAEDTQKKGYVHYFWEQNPIQ